MHDALLCSESILCWSVANYGYRPDPVRDFNTPQPSNKAVIPRAIVFWALGSGALLCLLNGFGWPQILTAAVVFGGAILTRWMRCSVVSVHHLAEFETATCGLFVLTFWMIAGMGQSWWPSTSGFPFTRGQCTAFAVGGAIMIFMVRGGDYIVRGLLNRAGGLPDGEDTEPKKRDAYAHGKMIGQIERIIVVLIVTAGSFQALAFFFAAKGLIRSRELEERSMADYFLLGSLASFLIGLVGGIVLRQSIAAFWK
jgi:hypothetical protein